MPMHLKGALHENRSLLLHGHGKFLWTAKTLAKELGDTEVIPMTRFKANPVRSNAEAVGMIFPVHIWGPPRRVLAFVDALEPDPSRYHFALAVNAGQVAATLIGLKRRMDARGCRFTPDSNCGCRPTTFRGEVPDRRRSVSSGSRRHAKSSQADRRAAGRSDNMPGREGTFVAEHPFYRHQPARLFPCPFHGQGIPVDKMHRLRDLSGGLLLRKH